MRKNLKLWDNPDSALCSSDPVGQVIIVVSHFLIHKTGDNHLTASGESADLCKTPTCPSFLSITIV